MQCVVCHDAGGAEVLASYISRQKGEWGFVLEGPARMVFERRLGAVSGISLDEALSRGERFLTGSSWQSDLEWRAIAAARRAGKPVATFLDHWVNYRERFVRGGVECLPDEIWVGDAYAFERAQAVLPEVQLHWVTNPYFEDIREEAARYLRAASPVGRDDGLRLLFVCEPISEHAEKAFGDPRHWGYTEFDALSFLLANRSCLGESIASLVIRPHPAEAPGKYAHVVTEWGNVARLGGTAPLIQEIMAADVVVGCASMAMVVGLLAGKRVCCAIPPGGAACPLPHREIEHLADIAGKAGKS